MKILLIYLPKMSEIHLFSFYKRTNYEINFYCIILIDYK